MRHLLAAWILLGLGVALTSRVAAEHLSVLSFLPVLVWGLAGLALLGSLLWKARHKSARRTTLCHVGAVIATAVLFAPVASLGGKLTERIRFAWQRPAYDRIVARAQAGKIAAGNRTVEGLDYIVDAGPPVRVAFVWPGGILDNWCGAVHDPSGEVLKVKDLPPWSNEWRHGEVTGLFGGDMVSCRSLDHMYYLCCFT
jgi:hypothetical protein